MNERPSGPTSCKCRPRAKLPLTLSVTTLVVLAAAPAYSQNAQLTDENVDRAIRRAVEWIKSERNEKANWEDGEATSDQHWAGNSGLALLALLYADENPRQDYMMESLGWLSNQSLNGTYAVGVRAHALALVPGKSYRETLEADVDWLKRACGPRNSKTPGAFRYTLKDAGRDFDNSASQYGVLGMWMASDAGVKISEDFWTLVEEHWLKYQNPDGGWSYQDGPQSTGSMTAAGLATLFVVYDKAHATDEGVFNGTSSALCGKHREAAPLIAALEKGLDWFAREFTPTNPHGDGQWTYYYLYGVERTGRASGRKYFRDRDWFNVGATKLLEDQQPDGSWRGDLRNTCFALMFLCHGRAPLLFNKLQHGDDWNNKLRDVAGLNKYCEQALERLLNWQIVRLDSPIEDLMEAPVLYMSGHTAWQFTDEEIEKLREYCNRGGMILGVACCSQEEFARGFKEMAKRVYPEREFRPVGADHPLLSGEVQYPIPEAPPLLEISNGVRTVMLLAPGDICAPWNQFRVRRWENYFQLGADIYLYATDKTSIRSRLETPNIPLRQVNIARTVRVARIQYSGNWQIEPYGWTRFGSYMNNEAVTRIEVEPAVRLDSDDLKSFPVAYMTGTAAFTLSDEEQKGLRRFLFGGGTLLADAAGGSQEFLDSFEKYVGDALTAQPEVLRPDSVILRGERIPDGVSLEGVGYRRAARAAGTGQRFPRLKAYEIRRRLAVIYSPLDLSVGLLGTNVYNVRGFEPSGALKILRNMVLYAQLGTADKVRLAREK